MSDALKPNEEFQKGEIIKPREAMILPKNVNPEKIMELDALILKRAGMLANPPAGHMARLLSTAEAINELRNAINDGIMIYVMELQGSRLGFRTDLDAKRDPETKLFGYNKEIVRDVMIEALLAGALMTGNEVNIIAGNCYLTKEHYIRRNAEFPGISDFVLEMGAPVLAGDKGAFVQYRVDWKLNGKPDYIEGSRGKEDDIDTRICIRVNLGMGTDAIFGKAERKIRKKVHERLTGVITTRDGDIDDPPLTPTYESTARRATKTEPPTVNGRPNFLAGMEEALSRMKTEGDIGDYFGKISESPLNGEEFARLTAACEKRTAELAASDNRKRK
jgi:hypothetical protein